jgi:hypothetical protein
MAANRSPRPDRLRDLEAKNQGSPDGSASAADIVSI